MRKITDEEMKEAFRRAVIQAELERTRAGYAPVSQWLFDPREDDGQVINVEFEVKK